MNKTIAATYSRVSLEEQVDNFSLSSQTRSMEKYAAEKGYRIAKEFVFCDPGSLGGELDRAGLTKLRDAVRAGLVKVVICHDPDRLSRNLGHLLLITEEFERAGAVCEFVSGAVGNTPEGRMMLSLKGAFAEYEKSKLKERTSRGRKEKAQQGHWPGGRPPYGYRYEGKLQGKRGELVIIPEQAAVVRSIFEMSASGSGLLDIARRLNEQGIRPLRAARWCKPVIAQILTNETYAGTGCYNVRQAAEPKTRRKPAEPGKSKRTSRTRRDRSEWISIPTPVIIEPTLFSKVREQQERNRAVTVGRPSIYLLRGLLHPEEKREVLRKMVDRILLQPGEVEITYNLPGIAGVLAGPDPKPGTYCINRQLCTGASVSVHQAVKHAGTSRLADGRRDSADPGVGISLSSHSFILDEVLSTGKWNTAVHDNHLHHSLRD